MWGILNALQGIVDVSGDAQTDRTPNTDTRKSMDHVSEQERQEPLPVSILVIFSSFGEPMAIWGGTGELNPKAILSVHCTDKISACELQKQAYFSWYRSQIMRIIFLKKWKYYISSFSKMHN